MKHSGFPFHLSLLLFIPPGMLLKLIFQLFAGLLGFGLRGSIPKHNFILWLAHLDKLPTKKRIAKYNARYATNYEFCGAVETRDHLFLTCSFLVHMWRTLLSMVGKTCSNITCWVGGRLHSKEIQQKIYL